MSKRPAPLDEAEGPARKRTGAIPANITAAAPATAFFTDPSLAAGAGSIRVSERRQQEWLRRSAQWPGLPPNEWEAKGVLGAGAYGIVGLWKYIGSNPGIPDHIVVKQQSKEKHTLWFESKLLSDIQASCNTEHVVKLYKAGYEEGGSGTSSADPHPFRDDGTYDHGRQVARMYLEYCEKGEMARKLRRYPSQHPEEYIWRILDCLAKALEILEHGTDDHAAPSWASPIAHFDIKPPNILIGKHNETHPRLEPFKLADFGLSLRVPLNTSDPAWIADSSWRATPQYITPEQLYDGHREREKIGTPSNVWALGAVLFRLLSGRYGSRSVQHVTMDANNQRQIEQQLFKTTSPTITQTQGQQYVTFGRSLRTTPNPYSNLLIELTHACLAYYPSMRPKARDILGYTTLALRALDQMNVRLDISGPVSFAEGGPPLTRPGDATFRLLTQEEKDATAPPGDLVPAPIPVRPRGRDFKNVWYPAGPLTGSQNLIFDSVVLLSKENWPWQKFADTPTNVVTIQPAVSQAIAEALATPIGKRRPPGP